MTQKYIITRTFDAPRDLVWKAWTTPDMLAQWFGPKGASGRTLKFDFRVGGIWHSSIQMPGAPEMWGKFTFQEISSKTKLVWLHSFSDAGGVNLTRHPFSPNWPLELITTVIFEDTGDKTKVTLTWVPSNATDIERKTFEEALPGMNQGWGGSFDQLEAFLAEQKRAA